MGKQRLIVQNHWQMDGNEGIPLCWPIECGELEEGLVEFDRCFKAVRCGRLSRELRTAPEVWLSSRIQGDADNGDRCDECGLSKDVFGRTGNVGFEQRIRDAGTGLLARW